MQSIAVILCRPQLDLNLGACARVMSNMDLDDLRIINPRDKDIVKKAYASASHANHILDKAKVYDSIEDSIADLSFVAMTSARPRDIEKRQCFVDDLGSILEDKISGKIGIVFGPERTGLTNQELSLADVLVQIKTGEKNHSYNLSHAVAIVLYAIFSKQSLSFDNASESIATKKELNAFFEYMIDSLDESNYFKDSQKRSGQSLNIKNIFTKNYLTSQDIKTLFGIIKHLKTQQKKIK